MGRNIGPQCRLCRADNTKLFLKGERCHSGKCPVSKKRPAPGKDAKSRVKKLSNYGVQLREKQKLKRLYGILEKQFRNTFDKANRMEGKTGDNLILLLERRLDNIVYRMRFASSRNQARQLVSHGHVYVNNRRVNIASYSIKENDVVHLGEKAKKMLTVKESLREYTRSGVYPWLEVDPDAMRGVVKAMPRRSDITDLADVKEQFIVELYSK